jgi:hypothetical protein
MFSGCTSLIAPPELPAKSCVDAASCYASMFAYCTSLTYAPALPIATIELESSHYYYDNMFQGAGLKRVVVNVLDIKLISKATYYSIDILYS